MKENNLSVFLKGILKENPVFVLILGTCPTLAVTSKVESAFLVVYVISPTFDNDNATLNDTASVGYAM